MFIAFHKFKGLLNKKTPNLLLSRMIGSAPSFLIPKIYAFQYCLAQHENELSGRSSDFWTNQELTWGPTRQPSRPLERTMVI